MKILIALKPENSLVVDVAPMSLLSMALREQAGDSYLSLDFDPAADGRRVDVQASLTHLPLREGQIGFMFCSHVLEHIPDDRAAMGEIYRALHDGGIALLQVPRRRNTITDEDPLAPVDERIRRFGQADHVRYYGDDFERRLRDAGLAVATTTYHEIFSSELLNSIGANKPEELWLVTRRMDAWTYLEIDSSVAAMCGSLLPSGLTSEVPIRSVNDLAAAMVALLRMAKQHESLATEAEEWKSKYLWLAGRPAVQLGIAAKKSFRKMIDPIRHVARRSEQPDDHAR